MEEQDIDATDVVAKPTMSKNDARTKKLETSIAELQDANASLKESLREFELMVSRSKNVDSPRPGTKKTLFDELTEMLGLYE